eukprot:TRINITY_DN2387_c0_g1_i9.p1 TRINITY_DN2387_c0_g1~~TRINITY_DN2387_c0_g1_i9.p1  ORF type:complete len:603 (-),score=100.78 TRINITY_DN2387_c0_g1_i9:811-2619(-)
MAHHDSIRGAVDLHHDVDDFTQLPHGSFTRTEQNSASSLPIQTNHPQTIVSSAIPHSAYIVASPPIEHRGSMSRSSSVSMTNASAKIQEPVVENQSSPAYSEPRELTRRSVAFNTSASSVKEGVKEQGESRASLALLATEVITMAREVGSTGINAKDIDQTYWQASAVNEEIQRILTIMFISAMTGVALMVVENEVLFSFNNEWNIYTTLLKALITVTTIISELTLWKYYDLTARQMKIRGLVVKGNTALPSNHWVYFAMEFICISLHPPPGLDISFTVRGVTGYDVEYTIDTIFGLLMLSRFYMLARMLKYVSGLHLRTAQVIGTLNKVDIDPSFAVKTILHKRPYSFLMSALILNLVVTAYGAHICERVYEGSQQNNYLESLWFMFVTIATIGYGDVVAHTYCARSFVMIGSVFGVITTALLISIVDQTLQLSQAQARVVTLLTKEKWTRTLKETAALSVQRMWRLRKGKGPNFLLRQKATSALHDWKEARRSYAAFLDKNDTKVQLQPLVEQLVGDFQILSTKMEVMEGQMNRMESVLGRLEASLPSGSSNYLKPDAAYHDHSSSLHNTDEGADQGSPSKQQSASIRRRSNTVHLHMTH